MPNDRTRDETDPALDRRLFLLWASVGTLSATLPGRALAHTGRKPEDLARTLSFFHMHTHEHLEVVYRSAGRYDPRALERIDHILRDHRTGEVKPIDKDLLELLYNLCRRLDTEEPFHVISGYRSPKTNERLRAQGRGVASTSLHLQGKAVDILVPGCDLAVLRDAAMEAQAGGVGYYPVPGFVHVDVGPIRSW